MTRTNGYGNDECFLKYKREVGRSGGESSTSGMNEYIQSKGIHMKSLQIINEIRGGFTG